MNYTPNDVVKKLYRIDDEVEKFCDLLANLSDELVDAETEYDITLSQELVRMEAMGKAKTTAEKIAKGQPHVIAKSIVVKGKKEQVKNLRQRIDVYRSRLSVGQSVLNWLNQKEKYDNYS